MYHKVPKFSDREVWANSVDPPDQGVHCLLFHLHLWNALLGPRQANLVLIAYASSEGSGEPAHPRSLARTFAARSYNQ